MTPPWGWWQSLLRWPVAPPGRRPVKPGPTSGWQAWPRRANRGRGLALALALALVVVLPLATPRIQPAWAGPVQWQEVPASEAGRQWWDRGSLRLSREGTLTVLSRFQPAGDPAAAEPGAPIPGAGPAPGPSAPTPGTAAGPIPTDQTTLAAKVQNQTPADAPTRRPRQPSSELYVSEIDCDQKLLRDTSINGIPQWRASWQPVAGDGLMEAVVEAVCEAGGQLLASR